MVKQGFLVCQYVQFRKKKRGFGVLENSASHVWEMCLNLESVGSIFVPDSGFATFWIFTFGSHGVFSV